MGLRAAASVGRNRPAETVSSATRRLKPPPPPKTRASSSLFHFQTPTSIAASPRLVQLKRHNGSQKKKAASGEWRMKCNGRAASAEVRPGRGEGEGELSECSECRECNCLLLNSFIPVPAPLRCSALLVSSLIIFSLESTSDPTSSSPLTSAQSSPSDSGSDSDSDCTQQTTEKRRKRQHTYSDFSDSL